MTCGNSFSTRTPWMRPIMMDCAAGTRGCLRAARNLRPCPEILSCQPPHPRPPLGRHGTQAAVGMADGAGESVGRIGGRMRGETQQPLHHLLHLFLARVSLAHHRLLDLERGVL